LGSFAKKAGRIPGAAEWVRRLTSSAVAMAAADLSLNVQVCHHILPPMSLHFTPCCPRIYSCGD